MFVRCLLLQRTSIGCEVRELLAALMDIDRMHKGYYTSLQTTGAQ
jgi:hypothetical protein